MKYHMPFILLPALTPGAFTNFNSQKTMVTDDDAGLSISIRTPASCGTCSLKLPNAKIRLKYNTHLASNPSFDPGNCQDLLVPNCFMPVEGWNILTPGNSRSTFSPKPQDICARKSFATPFTFRDQKDFGQSGRQIQPYVQQFSTKLAFTQTIKIKRVGSPYMADHTQEDCLSPFKYHQAFTINLSKYKEYSL